MLGRLLAGKQKAFVGGAISGLLTLLALAGITGDMTVKDALLALCNYVATHAAVWLTENK